MTPYYAAMTRRWHANADLSHTCDPVGYHGGRMAILALMLWPDAERGLLATCVIHDLGEYKTGDIPWGAPNKDHDTERQALRDMGFRYGYDDPRLKFLDSLDAYLWARHHAPHIMERKDWVDQRDNLLATANELGVCLDQFNIGE